MRKMNRTTAGPSEAEVPIRCEHATSCFRHSLRKDFNDPISLLHAQQETLLEPSFHAYLVEVHLAAGDVREVRPFQLA